MGGKPATDEIQKLTSGDTRFVLFSFLFSFGVVLRFGFEKGHGSNGISAPPPRAWFSLGVVL